MLSRSMNNNWFGRIHWRIFKNLECTLCTKPKRSRSKATFSILQRWRNEKENRKYQIFSLFVSVWSKEILFLFLVFGRARATKCWAHQTKEKSYFFEWKWLYSMNTWTILLFITVSVIIVHLWFVAGCCPERKVSDIVFFLQTTFFFEGTLL